MCVDERQASVWVSRSWVCVFSIASCLPTRVQVDKESVFAEVMRNSLSLCPCVLVTHTGGESLQEREASFMSRRRRCDVCVRAEEMRRHRTSGGGTGEIHKNFVHKGTEI